MESGLAIHCFPCSKTNNAAGVGKHFSPQITPTDPHSVTPDKVSLRNTVHVLRQCGFKTISLAPLPTPSPSPSCMAIWRTRDSGPVGCSCWSTCPLPHGRQAFHTVQIPRDLAAKWRRSLRAPLFSPLPPPPPHTLPPLLGPPPPPLLPLLPPQHRSQLPRWSSKCPSLSSELYLTPDWGGNRNKIITG